MLEVERYEMENVADRQKYDINQLRMRVQLFMTQYGKGKGGLGGKKQVKTLTNIGAKAAVFK